MCIDAGERYLVGSDAAGSVVSRALKDGAVGWKAASNERVVHCDRTHAFVASASDGTLAVRALALVDGSERWQHRSRIPSWVRNDKISVQGWSDTGGVGVAWEAINVSGSTGFDVPEPEGDKPNEASGAFIITESKTEIPLAEGPSFPPRPDRRSVFAGKPVKDVRYTWDGRHLWYLGDQGARIAGNETGAPLPLATPIGWSVDNVYVTRRGEVVVLRPVHEEREDGSTLSRMTAIVHDNSGAVRWSGELSQSMEPPPAP